MQKFIVLYCMPAHGLEEWGKIDPEKRKAEEERMMIKWNTWLEEHAAMFKGSTAGVGATKRVTSAGSVDAKNDIMLYAILEAESHDAAAKIFEGHPHLDIPGAWIDISPLNYLDGTNQ